MEVPVLYNDGMSSYQLFPDLEQFLEDGFDFPEENTRMILLDWSIQKIGTLQSRLETLQKSLDKCNSSKASLYPNIFPAHMVISLANELFGYNSWSSEILEYQMEDLDMHNDDDGRYFTHVSATVRVTLRDGVVSESKGRGEAKNMPYKHMCYNTCKKQAVTDATKKAIINLGKILLESERNS